jgi:hypothetical protein
MTRLRLVNSGLALAALMAMAASAAAAIVVSLI